MEKLTKKQLIEKALELQTKNNEYIHLAEAVEAKDVEIAKLTQALSERNNEVLEKNATIQTMEKYKIQHDKIVDEYNVLVGFVEEYMALTGLHLQQTEASLRMFISHERKIKERIAKEE